MIFLCFISILFAGYTFPRLESTDITTSNNSVHLLGIMVEFKSDSDPKTTGDGTFLTGSDEDYLDYYNSDVSKCSDPYLKIDPPPHNKQYFEDQISAVKNYYLSVSKNNIESFSSAMLDDVYQLDSTMAYYSLLSSYDEPDDGIAQLFSDGLDKASQDIDDYLDTNNLSHQDVLIVVFHAGVGEDYGFDGYIDPANYDIRSAYVEESMLSFIDTDTWIKQNGISKGILLPESLNLIYYDTVEDIYGYQPQGLCSVQIGMTGLFSYLLGYEFGLPEMFDRDSGGTRIGVFGLMDIGSFNTQGIIPAPPQAWSRANNNWSSVETASANDYYSVMPRYSSSESGDDVLRINISTSEYFLVEHVNNSILENYEDSDFSISEINNADTIGSYIFPDTNITSVFDKLLDLSLQDDIDIIGYSDSCDEDLRITISTETGVVLCADNYDYGLPGSGVLLWRVNEENVGTLNDNLDERTVELIEADGAQDIGFTNYLYPFLNPSIGWGWDFWFPDNEAYLFANPDQTDIVIDSYTTPSSYTQDHNRSYIALEDFRYSTTSDAILFKHTIEDDVFSYDEIIQGMDYNVVGTGQYSTVSYIAVDDIESDSIHIISDDFHVTCSDSDIDYSDGDFVLCPWAGDPAPECDDGSIKVCARDYYYSYEENGCVSLEGVIPSGYFTSNVHDNFISYEISNIPDQFLNIEFTNLGIGNIDNDGQDEIFEIKDGELHCYNKNGTSCNGFPLIADYHSNLIIANINSDIEPEIIVRNAEKIDIISSNGEILHSIPSSAPEGSLLHFIYGWNNNAGVVDGERVLLFGEMDLMGENINIFNVYWGSPGGLNSNEPTVDGGSHPLNYPHIDNHVVSYYNYPNPIRDGVTTFRFFTSGADKAEIKIYSVSGFHIDTILKESLDNEEYNEISWQSDSNPAGLYFAHLIVSSNSEELESKTIKIIIPK